jgi:hypothetical protein
VPAKDIAKRFVIVILLPASYSELSKEPEVRIVKGAYSISVWFFPVNDYAKRYGWPRRPGHPLFSRRFRCLKQASARARRQRRS